MDFRNSLFWERDMGLNRLLYLHQVALINAQSEARKGGRASYLKLAARYAKEIRAFRHNRGLDEYQTSDTAVATDQTLENQHPLSETKRP